ncbi:MAG: ComEC/Rec2 family competence protein [Verrucomicrobia bacterium]|nr:ComEC/Rec2 family competence protein [Verrucomicrobiota bacterium]
MSHPLLGATCLYAGGVLLAHWSQFQVAWLLVPFLALALTALLLGLVRSGKHQAATTNPPPEPSVPEHGSVQPPQWLWHGGRATRRGCAMSGDHQSSLTHATFEAAAAQGAALLQRAKPGMRNLPAPRGLGGAFLLIAAGWLNLAGHTRIWSDHDLRRCLTEDAALVQVRGRLVDSPRLTQHVRDEQPQVRSLVELEAAALRLGDGDWTSAEGRVATSTPGELGPNFFAGQVVEVSGVLSRPRGPLAVGLFDYATHLERRGVYFQLQTDGPGDWALAEGAQPTAPLTVQFIRWARRTLSRGLPEDDPATGLVQAMTLGWNTALTDEIEEPFMKSGTMHVFAISGQHIALLAGIVLSVLRVVRIPRGACGTLLIPLLWFYTAATGWQASAVRATVMMTLVLGGWSLRRPSDLLNSLAAAALVILLIEPRQLFQASFQLSFMVVLALALVAPPLKEHLVKQRESRNNLTPSSRLPRWKLWLAGAWHWLRLTLATSSAAWMGSLLLTAQYFHLFSLGSLLANVLLVPCAGAALASALASLATGAWWPWLSEVFNHGAWFWMHCMLWISKVVADLPSAWCYVPAPSAALWLVYLGAFLVAAFRVVEGGKLKWLLASSTVPTLMFLYAQYYTQSASSTVTALPLNGGLGIHLKSQGTWNPVLLDCGDTNAFRSVLAPFLRARGENRLRALLLTHGDARHMSAAPALLHEFPTASVGISTVRFRSAPYRNLIERVLPGWIQPTYLATGDHFEVWEVLHPPDGLQTTRADAGVLVLRGTVRRTTFLFLADLDREGQRRLLEAGPDHLRAEIVITGLPTDGEPLINDLLETVQPSLIVVGDDEWPANRRASTELLDRLRTGGRQVLNTRRTGAVTFRVTDRGWTAVNARGATLAESGEKACEPSASGL